MVLICWRSEIILEESEKRGYLSRDYLSVIAISHGEIEDQKSHVNLRYKIPFIQRKRDSREMVLLIDEDEIKRWGPTKTSCKRK
jgi:hypothetical protein